jgi:hypothetical protein
MRALKQLAALSSIALAGVLYLSGVGTAAALTEQAPTMQVASSFSHHVSPAADYRYQGKNYKYKYHGKYYNHRTRKNGKWRYY